MQEIPELGDLLSSAEALHSEVYKAFESLQECWLDDDDDDDSEEEMSAQQRCGELRAYLKEVSAQK